MSFVGDIIGAAIGADSSRHAVNTQADSVRDTNALQERMYNQTREDQTPFRLASYGALEQIQNLLKNPSSMTLQPDYQFGLDQGTRALNSGAAARGMTYSGAQAKALTRYGHDYSNTKLNESYNRLANVAQLGQVAVSGRNNENYANQVGNNLMDLGNTRAGASMYQGRNWGNAANSLANWSNKRWGGSGGDAGYGAFPQWGRGGGFGSGTEGMGD